MLAAALLIALSPLPARAAFPGVQRSTEPIVVVYPPEGAFLPSSDGDFVMGSVSDPKGRLEINGQAVKVHPAGGFLAWVKVSTGPFSLSLSLALSDKSTQTLLRGVTVQAPASPLPPEPLAIDAGSLLPREDLELRGGDWLLVRLRGSPGREARFRLGRREWRPMVESRPGSYEGALRLPVGERLPPQAVHYELGSGWAKESAESRGTVSVLASLPRQAVLKGSGGVLLATEPGGGELFPVLGGARLMVSGRDGSNARVLLGAGQEGWIEARHLEPLPEGTPPPRAVTGALTTKWSEDSTALRLSLGERVPFEVTEAPDLGGLTVRLHYATAHTNWMIYDSSDPFVAEARVRQETSETVLLAVRLRPGETLWGFHASWEGSSLKLELRRPPRVARAPASPLSGRTIFIDPGHMPSSPGALGPLGTREADLNFALAKAVEAQLLKERAVPVLSRRSPEDEVGLHERPRQAWERKADVYLSIHNNQLAPGRDPFAWPRGSSVFYYHPHSLALAREVYESLEKAIPIAGEGLRYGDLLVLRLTQMPSVLAECAYMTFPEQEQLLLDARFRDKVARGIVSGLRSFFAAERSRQPRSRGSARPPSPPREEPAASPARPSKRRAGTRRAQRLEEPT